MASRRGVEPRWTTLEIILVPDRGLWMPGSEPNRERRIQSPLLFLLSYPARKWRPRPESNRRMRDLQSQAFPLSYAASGTPARIRTQLHDLEDRVPSMGRELRFAHTLSMPSPSSFPSKGRGLGVAIGTQHSQILPDVVCRIPINMIQFQG